MFSPDELAAMLAAAEKPLALTDTIPLTVVLTDAQFWKLHQRCIECHQIDAYTLNGRSLCAVCAEKSREAKRTEYQMKREELNQRHKKWYEDAKANGKCVKCGASLEPGSIYVRCQKCRNKAAYRDKLKRASKPQRGDNGICYICNRNPKAPDKNCCEECYPKLREQMLFARSCERKGGGFALNPIFLRGIAKEVTE